MSAVQDPKIVMTLMVRDEVDILAAMLEHHLAQGVDLIIVTDNGSIDGTREVLAQYEQTGRVEVHDYLRHDKNQSAVVSGMASRAARVHGADWVINADADEFFLPVDRSRTLAEVFAEIPVALGSFVVPVTNVAAEPTRSGVDLHAVRFRDERPAETLMETVSLFAHPTGDAIHVGRDGVLVQQGNHGVDIESMGEPDEAARIEVLHVPWRSFEQYQRRVVNTGIAYESNPERKPSPLHHGMRDYRFWRAGVLEPVYLRRAPAPGQLDGFVEDHTLGTVLDAIAAAGPAVPEAFAAVTDATGVERYQDEQIEAARAVASIAIPVEIEGTRSATIWRDLYREEAFERGVAADALAAAQQRRGVLGRLRRIAGRVVRRVTGGRA